MNFFKKQKLLIGMMVGIILGLVFKDKASILKPIGTIFLNLIFVIIVPLVFFSITTSVSKIKTSKLLKKILSVSIIVMITTLFVTGIYTTFIANIINPYSNSSIIVEETTLENIDITDKIVNMLSTNDFVNLYSKSNIFALIIFSIIIGIAINSISKNKEIISLLENGKKTIINYLNIIMKFAPIGIACYLAALIDDLGGSFVMAYAKICIMYLVLGIVNILVFHTIYLLIAGGKKLVKNYYKNIFKVVLTAFSTQSSVITMPTNMNAMKSMGVSSDVVEICTPYMTIINMQGNVIENLLKIFFLCSMYQVATGNVLTFIFYIFISMFAGMITGGIPSGGVISNTILVTTLAFPSSALPILITIELLLDAPATVFNVLSDTSTIGLVEKFAGDELK